MSQSSQQTTASLSPHLNSKLDCSQYLAKDATRWAGLGFWCYDVQRKEFDVGVDFFNHCRLKRAVPCPLNVWIEMIHPEDRQRCMNAFSDVLEDKIDHFDQQYRILTLDGFWSWFRARGGVRERDANGQIITVSGTIQDIAALKETEEVTKRSDRFLEVAGECARILLDPKDEQLDEQLNEVLELIGKAAQVDRVCIWKNHRHQDGKIFSVCIRQWVNTESDQITEKRSLTELAFAETVPGWEETLISGKCINRIVRKMPENEQELFLSAGAVSFIAAPIMFRDEFWGFIGLDDCLKERIWDEREASVLKSTGILIASKIMRQLTEQKLEEERSLLRQIFETSPTGVVITTNGIVRRGNQRFFDLFQVDVGTSCFSMYADPTIRENILADLKTHGTVFNRNCQFLCADGVMRDFLATYQEIDYENEKSLLCWTVDISELKKTEKALLLARDLAEVGTRAKSDFLARMSHEIRTPMNAILGMTYLCLQTELTEKQKDYLVKTQTATSNLLRIIDDILDFSKIEAGKLDLENIQFRLSDVLRDVTDLVDFKAREKGLYISIQVADDVGDSFLGDPLRLRQILTNLINNAVKFTDKGGITVHVKAQKKEQKDEDYVHLHFSVEDSGIGMNQTQLANLFQSFSQADESTTRKYGGTGLGLAISKNLVELMGGEIKVESREGEGTQFHFTLSFTRVAPIVFEDSGIILSERRILVVDDDAAAREFIRELVSSLAMRVDVAESGEIALGMLAQATREKDPYDLVLLDWKMPRMDGLETIRQIRASDQIEEPPQILMISAFDRNECLRQSRGLGLSGFLVKPVTRKSLRQSISQAFEQAKGDTNGQEKSQKPDLHGVKVLLVEDNKINQMVALELLTMLGVSVTLANNGKEAVEIVRKSDFDLILMDIQMPVMDGLAATQEIRQLSKPGIDKLPILAMTANAMDSDYKKSLEVGMSDHLTKPIDPARLKQALETWIVR